MQTIYLLFQTVYVVGVVDDIIGTLESGLPVNLSRDDVTHIVFTYVVTLHGALDLDVDTGINDQYAINTVLPASFK